MNWIKTFFQRLTGNSTKSETTAEAVKQAPNHSQASSTADQELEVSEKIERMARKKRSDPLEYRSLTPSQRLRYIVKKTEYQSPPMQRRRTYFPVPKHLLGTPLFRPIPYHRSIKKAPENWKLSSKIGQRLCSKKSHVTTPQPRHMHIRHVPFDKRQTTHNKQHNHKRPFPGVKRPRPSPAEGSYCRAPKRFRYTDVEPVRGVKRPGSQHLDNSAEPTAKRRRCVKTVMRRRRKSVHFGIEETVKEEMNGNMWNHRLANARVTRRKEEVNMVCILAVCRDRPVFEG